ncbi:MAG: alpha-E domain-containing protein [Calditrichaeota bacterium]|nr:alpha-E domain-containing protein [Calditrichota bacterium]
MLSRVAEAIYWMNRYVERAENVARFIDVNLYLHLDAASFAAPQWQPLVSVTGDNALFQELYSASNRENVIRFLTLDYRNPNSIVSCLRAARENARSVREVISSEMWEQINRFYLEVNSADADGVLGREPYAFFSGIKSNAHLLNGITEATMTHGEAWHFGRLGRMIERADKTSRILDVKYFLLLPSAADVGTPFDNIQWMAVLKSASALEMYRKVWGRIVPAHVVEFLVMDKHFPRAIYYAIVAAERSLRRITGLPEDHYQTLLDKKVGKLRSELHYADISEIIRGGLHEFLDGLQIRLNDIGNEVFQTFFALRPVEESRN